MDELRELGEGAFDITPTGRMVDGLLLPFLGCVAEGALAFIDFQLLGLGSIGAGPNCLGPI